jgi:hypothetical protein
MLSIVGGRTTTVKVVLAIGVPGYVAVMIVVPGVRAVARPPGEVMVATAGLLLVQVTAALRSLVVPSV